MGCGGHCVVCYRIYGALVLCHEGRTGSSVTPYNPLDKSIGGGAGGKPTPRCRLCPFLASQRVPHTGMCLTTHSAHSGQPHGSHSHIQGQWIGGWSPTRGCAEDPSLLHPRMLTQLGPPGASPRAAGQSLVTSQHPRGWVTCQPPAALPSQGQGQGEAGVGAGSDSAQGQLLILALGAGERSPRASCIG